MTLIYLSETSSTGVAIENILDPVQGSKIELAIGYFV